MPIHIYKYLSVIFHIHTHADLQQEDGVHEAEQVHQYAHNEQDGPISQTEGVQQEQMSRHQAAHQTSHPIQQLHSHYRLHGTRTRVTSFKSLSCCRKTTVEK